MHLKVLWTISNSMGTASDLKMLKNIKDFEIEVVTTDRIDKDSVGFVLSGKKYILPVGSKSDYIDRILEICHRENITTIIPQYGDELAALSKNIELFKDLGVKVLVTEDTEKLIIANNKKNLYEFFKGSQIIPDYYSVTSIEGLEKTIYDLGYPDVPVCIKPANSEGGTGFRIVTEEKVDIFNEQAPIPKVSMEVLMHQLKRIGKIPELIVMEYLPGKEYSVDCVCKKGEAYICIPRQRIETAMGVATASVIEKNNEIINYSREIISKLNLSYNINIQFKYSRFGHLKLTEINPRVSGSLVTNYGAGVNMLELALKLAYGQTIETIEVQWGTKMLRYWDQIFIK